MRYDRIRRWLKHILVPCADDMFAALIGFMIFFVILVGLVMLILVGLWEGWL